MADGAAFFDLDRTLLRGASGPVFSEMLRAAGVIPDRTIPGESLVYKFFDVVGETLPSMLVTRQMARMASGWDRAVVQEAGWHAAERLIGEIQPYARVLIDHHHEAGRRVVMATTSPFDLVNPLADLLGMDDVIATRYGERDGAYDGSVAGFFVWGPGKLNAVKDWAKGNDVDVRESWAYSDSIYDVPLLSAVRHPVAVNPDPRLAIYAAVRRWPRQHLDAPAGVPKLAGIEPQQVTQLFSRPELIPYARFDIEGIERIPKRGAAILVANHRSYFDTMALSVTIAKVGRPLRFLGKKEVFDAPIVGQLATAMGGIRVERGTGSDEPLEAAADALKGGQAVALMPQGTIPRGEAFFEPELSGRWGAAKLAKLTGAPIIPIGLWGTEKVWPRSARLPNMLAVGHPPTIRVRVGDPVELPHESLDDDTARIMAAIVDLLPPEARKRHKPTPEELALTLPPGHKGGTAERERRPGTD
jgi:putative phosphoserine phosphatase/1-acylglycerol-3-phosphate O-acyltransferase